jgi:hypothetical protein
MLKTIAWLKIVPVVFIIMAMATTVGCGEKSSPISGEILINIKYGYNFIEFKLQNGKIIKTSEGEVIPVDKEKMIPYSDWSEDFKHIYSPERLYYYEQNDKLAEILSQYDLQELFNIVRQFSHSKGNLTKDRYLLTGPGKKLPYFWGKYADHFIPNQQFSYIVYYDRSYPDSGALINVTTKEISLNPLGLDRFENPVWNGKGQYLAYSTPNNDDRSRSILVIRDIDSDRNLLKKSIGKYVSDIAWSPDSKYVALLTYTGRIGLLPWDLLVLLSGHPPYVSWFNLEIYDLSGNRILYKKLNGSFKEFSGHSRGRLVWTP